jgi:hypothetical protein
LNELGVIGDVSFAWRETFIEGGEEILQDYLWFRRGIVGVFLTVIHILSQGADQADASAEEIFSRMDQSVIQALLATQPYPAGVGDLKNIPIIYVKK